MRFIILLFPLLITLSLQAQYERGNWYLSGNSSIEAGKQSTVTGSDFIPHSASRTGLFLLDRLLVGGNVIDPAIFVRYYQPLKPQSKWSAFAELNVAAQFSSRRGVTLTYQPAIGLEYQFSPGILLSATVQHSLERDFVRNTSLHFGINTVIGRGGLAPGQDMLQKGTVFIDPNIGNIGFGKIKLTDFDINTFGFSLHAGGGLMLTDRLSLDGSISASNYQAEYESPDFGDPSGVELAADLGLRFFVTGTGKFRPYVGAGIISRYGLEDVIFETPAREDFREDTFEFSPYGKLGTLFFLSDKLALDASLEYNFRDDDSRQATTSQLGLGVGVKIFLAREQQR